MSNKAEHTPSQNQNPAEAVTSQTLVDRATVGHNLSQPAPWLTEQVSPQTTAESTPASEPVHLSGVELHAGQDLSEHLANRRLH